MTQALYVHMNNKIIKKLFGAGVVVQVVENVLCKLEVLNSNLRLTEKNYLYVP
jgi:citrate lyase gamma subunit